MTIKELIELLQLYDGSKNVYIYDSEYDYYPEHPDNKGFEIIDIQESKNDTFITIKSKD